MRVVDRERLRWLTDVRESARADAARRRVVMSPRADRGRSPTPLPADEEMTG